MIRKQCNVEQKTYLVTTTLQCVIKVLGVILILNGKERVRLCNWYFVRLDLVWKLCLSKAKHQLTSLPLRFHLFFGEIKIKTYNVSMYCRHYPAAPVVVSFYIGRCLFVYMCFIVTGATTVSGQINENPNQKLNTRWPPIERQTKKFWSDIFFPKKVFIERLKLRWRVLTNVLIWCLFGKWKDKRKNKKKFRFSLIERNSY